MVPSKGTGKGLRLSGVGREALQSPAVHKALLGGWIGCHIAIHPKATPGMSLTALPWPPTVAISQATHQSCSDQKQKSLSCTAESSDKSPLQCVTQP